MQISTASANIFAAERIVQLRIMLTGWDGAPSDPYHLSPVLLEWSYNNSVIV